MIQAPPRQEVETKRLKFASRGKKRVYLRGYVKYGSHVKAMKVAEVSNKTHYDWLAADETYAQDFALAKEHVADQLEAALTDRAVHGVVKPTGWYKGEAGGFIREYDTTAGIFMLKGLRPDTYAERTHNTVDVHVKHTDAQLHSKLQRLLDNNPDVRKDLGLALESDVIDGEFTEGGVGPPNEAGASAIDPSPSSGASSPENNSGVVADSKKSLPGADYYDGA